MIGARLQRTAANLALKAALATDGRRRWRSMEALAAEPERAQTELLTRIITTNSTTAFGQDHGFASVDHPESYRSAVPVQRYESLRPYIERQETEGNSLTVEAPVLFARTSGTTGSPKDIPVTASTIERLSATQRLYSYGLSRASQAFDGKVLGIGGGAIEGYRVSGIPYGSATGLIYEQMPRVVRSKYVLPPAVLGIEDYETKYAVIAALALAANDLTSIATANPSTIARLHRLIVERWDELVTAVGTGDLAGLGPLESHQAAAVAGAVQAAPDRARELVALEQRGEPRLGDLWPRLGAIVGWTGGSCGFALQALEPQLEQHTQRMEYGYSASEFRGTIGIDKTSFGMPTIWDNYLEFVPAKQWEAGGAKYCGIADLEPGEQYYLFVTTPDGLYRYDMNDVMEAGPRFGKTPTLAFVRKGRGTTNITGEKLTEEQVLEAVGVAAAELGIHVAFFVALADTAEARYRVFLEPAATVNGHRSAGFDPDTFAQLADRTLGSTNIEYQAKRSSGRLEALVVQPLAAGAGAAYRHAKVAGGQRDAQFKHLHLQPADDFDFDFAAAGLLR